MNPSYPLKFPFHVLDGESLHVVHKLPEIIQTKVVQTIQKANIDQDDELGSVLMKMRASLSDLHKEENGFPIIEIGGEQPSTITLFLITVRQEKVIHFSLDEIKAIASIRE